MKIYITSSWVNAHAVNMLAIILKQEGLKVNSFVADNQHEISVIGQQRDPHGQDVDYEEWVFSLEGERVFSKDMASIEEADVVVVIEPAGRDSWATVGMAKALKKKVYGLNSKARKVGIMRRLVLWMKDVPTLVRELNAEQLRRYREESSAREFTAGGRLESVTINGPSI